MLGISALAQLPLAGFPSSQSVLVGAILGGRRRKPQTLAEFEADQPKPFGRKWFAEFKAAEQAAQEAIERAQKKAARKALVKAADAAAEVSRGLDRAPPTVDLEPITRALEASAKAKKLEETVRQAREAERLAKAVMESIRQAQEDEDEAVMLLLMN